MLVLPSRDASLRPFRALRFERAFRTGCRPIAPQNLAVLLICVQFRFSFSRRLGERKRGGKFNSPCPPCAPSPRPRSPRPRGSPQRRRQASRAAPAASRGHSRRWFFDVAVSGAPSQAFLHACRELVHSALRMRLETNPLLRRPAAVDGNSGTSNVVRYRMGEP